MKVKKNVWTVEMPEFVKHKTVKKKENKKEMSEMDDEYHTKFRASKAQSSIQKKRLRYLVLLVQERHIP